IVLAVAILLSRPLLFVPGLDFPVTLALLTTLGAAVFYFRLDLRFGVVMTAVLAAALAAGYWLAMSSTVAWLAVGLGLFVVGWVFQFVGHIYEGRKPAFVDDLIGLLVGPLFIVAEIGFALGMRTELRREIERRAGPTHPGRQASAA
ncbi:MAG TPA: Mpo1-like protein, partial [Burkholderiaceae bacterium]|nr:Mpo1-like protein [Burkholderiaceae bacterium]